MKELNIETIKAFKELLGTSAKRIVIVPHVNPDGDAVGSALGMARVLKNAGHGVNVLSVNDYPGFYSWMTGHNEVSYYSKVRKKLLNCWMNQIYWFVLTLIIYLVREI